MIKELNTKTMEAITRELEFCWCDGTNGELIFAVKKVGFTVFPGEGSEFLTEVVVDGIFGFRLGFPYQESQELRLIWKYSANVDHYDIYQMYEGCGNNEVLVKANVPVSDHRYIVTIEDNEGILIVGTLDTMIEVGNLERA